MFEDLFKYGKFKTYILKYVETIKVEMQRGIRIKGEIHLYCVT